MPDEKMMKTEEREDNSTSTDIEIQLEEYRLQGVRKLAVNGKVSGYCVHLPICNLQTVKSTEKVSRLREST